MDSSVANVEVELSQRHKVASTTVIGLLVAIVVLCVIAYVGKAHFPQLPNPSLEMAVWIAIFVLGLGSIVWRRTKFSTMRLQDIGALQGAPGLLGTLQKTTIQLALAAFAMSAIGFLATLRTGDEFYTYRAGAIAAAFLLLYCYPTKSSWIGTLQKFAEKPDTSATNSSEN
jgi:FtsH-binding integral membrane protein